MTTALLVYYNLMNRDRLERSLRSQGIEVYSISGRDPNAKDSARRHPADIVVIDSGANDISLNQAVRQIARLMPKSLIYSVGLDHRRVGVFRNGRRIGTVDLNEIR